jgi:hypothetical protein
VASVGEAAVSAVGRGIGFHTAAQSRGRFEPNTDGAALIDKGTLGGMRLTTSSGVNIVAIQTPPRDARAVWISGLKPSLTVDVQL